ncbi:MAG: hypothetical protein MPJ50_15900 [Pirellulales bacterium]|nr:hypothetical protein [Pirellulales bacterium]
MAENLTDNGCPKRLRTSRGNVLGQIIFCEGCCCGRVDRGMPAFPKKMIKAEWKAQKLNNTIQLTISGCLGPCDLVNVACVITHEGDWIWLGSLSESSHYETIIDWAIACQSEGRLIEFPASLSHKRFERFG